MLFNDLQYVVGEEFENGLIVFSGEKPEGNPKRVKYHCVTGFHIPSLPVSKQAEDSSFMRQLFRRFVAFLRNMRNFSGNVAFGIYTQASPEKSQMGARVNFYLLCRASDRDEILAIEESRDFAERLQANFPRNGLMGLVVPRPAKKEEIEQLLFCDISDQKLQTARILKHTESMTIAGLPADVPAFDIQHPFLSDAGHELWADLIEILSKARARTVLSINLEPVDLSGRVLAIAEQAQQYRKIRELNQRRFEIQQSVAGMAGGSIAGANDPNKLLLEASWYKILRIPDSVFSYIDRGHSCFADLLTWSDQVFSFGISMATEGKFPHDLVDAVRGSLMSLDSQQERSRLGWSRPDFDSQNKSQALNNLRWMDHSNLRKTRGNEIFKYLATAEEASILFHIPVFSPGYQSSAVSLVDSPFMIPPEVLSVDRFKPDEKLISIGNLYQRDQITTLDFKIRLDDLLRPSLLVGAPGSGKSNLALYLLSQFWENHETPFLVLDPSTGHEYRFLLADSKYTQKLKDDLVVFTCGDEVGLPFRFNPFDVPPGMILRAHITRLLSCFKAAYEMWDPLPAIYESALIRLYTSDPYTWNLNDKGGTGKPCPCMSDFAKVIIDELNENVLPDYGDGSEASGILTGASKIRVNGILNSIGHIINVREDCSEYFQKLLRRPVVIELGSVGDTNSIALVMAFLVTQLVGHIEYAYPEREQAGKMHLILIEEAHRMLSAEASGSSSQNQGNTRGKSAEELNTLLAEVRKFRQGIMILDQRPSSLVGGVLDNSDINIMCRLNDRAGFEHLSNVTNLSPEQQKYVRTRFQPGDAVLLDKDSGLPVLIKSENVVDDLRKAYRENFALLRENADRYHLSPLVAEPWSPAQSKKDTETGSNVLGQVIQAPMKTCAFCLPYQKEMQCPYFDEVRLMLTQSAAFEIQIQQWLERVGYESYKHDGSLSVEEHADWKKDLDDMLSQAANIWVNKGVIENDVEGVRYCYFAQTIDRWQHNDLQHSDEVVRWKKQVAGSKLLQYLYQSSSK